MTRLSTHTLVPSLRGPGSRQFIPFTVFARVVPNLGLGRRFEMVRDLEKQADLVEDDLDTLDSDSAEISFDFATPVAFTPQFADKTARLTIHGNVTGLTLLDKRPIDDVTVDFNGGARTGQGSATAPRRVPTTELDAAVTELKILLEAIVDDIFRIEIAGFIYGQGGLHFPA